MLLAINKDTSLIATMLLVKSALNPSKLNSAASKQHTLINMYSIVHEYLLGLCLLGRSQG